MTMKRVSKGLPDSADFELSNGALIEVKAGVDLNGKPVIKSLKVFFPTKMRQLPEGGISQKIIDEIDLNLAITDELTKGFQVADKDVLKRLAQIVEDGFHRAGRTPVNDEAYASLAFLYLDACKTHPGNPNLYLADLFGIERGTIIARLAKSKRLGILDYQAGAKPSGRAGAKLSVLGEKLVKKALEGSE
jgi:hypothetical protein